MSSQAPGVKTEGFRKVCRRPPPDANPNSRQRGAEPPAHVAHVRKHYDLRGFSAVHVAVHVGYTWYTWAGPAADRPNSKPPPADSVDTRGASPGGGGDEPPPTEQARNQPPPTRLVHVGAPPGEVATNRRRPSKLETNPRRLGSSPPPGRPTKL